MDKIKFQNKEYKVREIELLDVGEVLISTTSLNQSLLNNEGGYVSNDAILVDEKIYYFVEEDKIEIPEEELICLLTNELK